MYAVDRGGGLTQVYCKMTLLGGGWELVSNVVSGRLGVRGRAN